MKKIAMQRLKLSGRALLGLVALSGCTVGPNYHGPTTSQPVPSSFHRAGAAAQVAPAPGAGWWTAYRDPVLDALVAEALRGNLDLAAADARLRQSRAVLSLRKRDQAPTGEVTGGYQRRKVALAGIGLDFPGLNLNSMDLFQAEFDASWELDLFGGNRRAVQAARADTQAADARLADTRVAIIADISSNYVDLRSTQARLALGLRLADAASEVLRLTELRRRLGTASDTDIDMARADLARAQANAEPLRARIDADLDSLAVLTGRVPGEDDARLTGPGTPLSPPDAVAIGDPAALLRRRPDVRGAERSLAGDVARIGVATADLFPKVSLTGSYGHSAAEVSTLTSSNSLGFSIGPSISWAFPDFGRVRAHIAQAKAKKDESLALYQGTVLRALQDAETALSRYGRDRDHVASLTRVEQATAHDVVLARMRYRLGTGSMVDLLESQRQQIQAEDTLLDAQADLAKGYASLSKALGFGWDI